MHSPGLACVSNPLRSPSKPVYHRHPWNRKAAVQIHLEWRITASYPASVTTKTICSHIRNDVITKAVKTFPEKPWIRFSCRDLFQWRDRNGVRERDRRRVQVTPPDTGGVYAFLLPGRFFRKKTTLMLHASSRKRIPFVFSDTDFPHIDDFIVVYVGKTGRPLRTRIQGHFTQGNQGLAQVQNGLICCRLRTPHREAISLMREHADLAVYNLPGDDNAANRDVIETSLIAKYRSPFNIKAEH